MSRHIPPKSRLLESTARREISLENCTYELIDNALDAGANHIKLTYHTGAGSYFRIEDNGRGCPNLDAMIVLGAHDEGPDRKIGYWGIGGTESYIVTGGIDSVCTIRSVHGNRVRDIVVAWRHVESNNWEYPDAKVSDAQPGESSGTSVLVSPLVKRARSWEALSDEIAQRYWPAIQRGVVIELRSPKHKSFTRIVAPEFPLTLPGSVNATVTFGKYKAHIRCGIVPEGAKNPMPGFTYFCNPRVIKARSSDGAGGHSIAQIFGLVELAQGWDRGGLSALKQEFEADESLYAKVHEQCEELLRKAVAMGQSLQLRAYNDAVADVLDRLIDRTKPNRKRKNAPAAKERKDPPPRTAGRPHASGEKQQAGQTFAGDRSASRIRISHRELGKPVAGEVVGTEIILNLERPLVREAFQSGDLKTSAIVALALLNEANTINPPARKGRHAEEQQPLPMGDPSSVRIISERFGSLLDALFAFLAEDAAAKKGVGA